LFMVTNWYLIFAGALVESFLISLVLTGLMRWISHRWDIVDHPGERKIHEHPIPVLGGVAIYLTFNLVIFGNLLLLEPAGALGFDWIKDHVQSYLSESTWRPLIGVVLGGFVIFTLGVVDDLKALSPEKKLVGQILAALILVISGIRLDLFIGPILSGVPGLSGMEPATFELINVIVSSGVTMFWVIMMTNSMNFLDNMDGLCGGISIIAALSFFICILPHEEYFICALLMVFAGSVGGFLFHNFNPARIFMGDSGAMFCGYMLATIAVLGTFYTVSISSPAAVAAPLLALSVPIFDTLSVVFIRWRKGESIMKGDKRHFSHRLVSLGMEPRQAVEFIYLVAVINGLGGALLARVGIVGTVVILTQVIGIFLMIVLLMKARHNRT
jgi:UDP-GlcNAc:undecaprenyl-phosphate/decaprenyl-phosphate GlcNAc-1-phosphate transferase